QLWKQKSRKDHCKYQIERRNTTIRNHEASRSKHAWVLLFIIHHKLIDHTYLDYKIRKSESEIFLVFIQEIRPTTSVRRGILPEKIGFVRDEIFRRRVGNSKLSWYRNLTQCDNNG